MNIFLRELKANFRSLLIWAGIVALFTISGFAKFTGYYDNPDLIEVLNSFPPAFLAAFNMNAFNLTTVPGFFGVMFTFYSLLLSIAAVMWGSDIISKEERDKTVEFSLTLPIRRSRIITAKVLAALINCIALLLFTWGISLLNVAKYSPDGDFYTFLSLGMLSLFFMQVIFLAIGVFLGCAMKRYKQANSIAVSILLGTYFLSILSGLQEDLEFLKYATPFKYFDPALLLRESSLDWSFVALSLGIIAVFIAGSYITYTRRDLYI
ncbi:MAG TPA: ABC transporter permease subunit [Anaerolineae bacterium]|nr:ABC transporter permease subunit [Anaerolineae bacterium]